MLQVFSTIGEATKLIKTIFSDLSCFQFCAKFLIFRRNFLVINTHIQSSRPEVFLRKGVLKIHSKFTGERPCQSAISVKLQSNFIEITLRYGCSPVNLLHIFRTPSLKNTSARLLLSVTLIRTNSCYRQFHSFKMV